VLYGCVLLVLSVRYAAATGGFSLALFLALAVRSISVAYRLRKSAFWFIAQHEVARARERVAAGRRLQARNVLLQVRYGAASKRWLLTAFIALFVPSHVVAHWQRWRVRRTDTFSRQETAP
jgi:hypothetical protein